MYMLRSTLSVADVRFEAVRCAACFRSTSRYIECDRPRCFDDINSNASFRRSGLPIDGACAAIAYETPASTWPATSTTSHTASPNAKSSATLMPESLDSLAPNRNQLVSFAQIDVMSL